MDAVRSGAALSRVGTMDDERAAVDVASPGELVGGLLHVDLAALKANYRQLAKAVQPAEDRFARIACAQRRVGQCGESLDPSENLRALVRRWPSPLRPPSFKAVVTSSFEA